METGFEKIIIEDIEASSFINFKFINGVESGTTYLVSHISPRQVPLGSLGYAFVGKDEEVIFGVYMEDIGVVGDSIPSYRKVRRITISPELDSVRGKLYMGPSEEEMRGI